MNFNTSSNSNALSASITAGGGAGAGTPFSREAFLSYFFGQNGPGPVTGTSLDQQHHHHPNHHRHGQLGGAVGDRTQSIAPVGRDVSGGNSVTGLMAGKRVVDGNSAAYDMKSLGKHIEAVSPTSVPLISFAVITERSLAGFSFLPTFAFIIVPNFTFFFPARYPLKERN